MSDRNLTRRRLLQVGAVATGLAVTEPSIRAAAAPPSAGAPKIKVGTVTYNIGMSWDIPTLIKNCKATGLQAVELRTSHKHGVEPSLPIADREKVKGQFLDSGIVLWGLGTTCEFHSPDPAKVKQQIALCRDFCVLAHDVGARGVKVRPNGLPKEVPVEKTLEQIGRSLAECGTIAQEQGVELWCEVHGGGTAQPKNMAAIMRHANHPNVGVTWNSNGEDVKDGSVAESFELLKPWIRSIHTKDLYDRYPYREFFGLLKTIGYDRYALAEIGESSDPLRVLRYFVTLFNELVR